MSFHLSENYIDGKEFIKLTEAEVKAMVVPIGLAKKILRLIPKVYIYTVCVFAISLSDSAYSHTLIAKQ